MRYFTLDNLSDILGMNKTSLQELVNTGKIPYKVIDGVIMFCPEAITGWHEKLRHGLDDKEFEEFIKEYKKQLWENNPESMKVLQEFNSHFTERWTPKRFYINPKPSKKLGFIYYVRYLENGKLIPSSWCTHTNDYGAAERFAIENRERILTAYFNRDNVKKKDGKIIPGIKPQTVGHYISYISQIFDHLLIEGDIKINPCKSLTAIKKQKTDYKARGCYEAGKLKGVFNKKWKDEFSYLLSLVIYTTDMRNSEIEKIQLKDFFMIDNVHFLDIPESKSANGVRIVPVHDFVYRKIMAYVRKNKIGDYIFRLPNCKKLGSKRYKAAYTELASYTGYTAEQLEKENITFYSGRHFWKTLMNSENLGDAEEYFMGHKVSADVAKNYNHRDKQGKKKLLEKTRKVFQILDKRLFT